MGGRITDKRKEKGFTQQGLAERCGVSRATINALEGGRANNVTVGTLLKIAKVLECSVNDIFF